MFYCQFDTDNGLYWQEVGPDTSELINDWKYSGCMGYSNWGLDTDNKPKKCLNKANEAMKFNNESLLNEDVINEINKKKVGNLQLDEDILTELNKNIDIKPELLNNKNNYCKVFRVNDWKTHNTELNKLKNKTNKTKEDNNRIIELNNLIENNKKTALNKCKINGNDKYTFDRFNNTRINKSCLRPKKVNNKK